MYTCLSKPILRMTSARTPFVFISNPRPMPSLTDIPKKDVAIKVLKTFRTHSKRTITIGMAQFPRLRLPRFILIPQLTKKKGAIIPDAKSSEVSISKSANLP
ncbi:hypothetical protein L6164_032774 [Bauhinia variegata]|uniref:Uncharacterized protein n=1 Tax=Bauhinia variegata TaxID=167791 RepID=A0ACB9KPR0_BAUVA|nr:hypothetical protein L6164_032774 [Bauhinia variegata]